MLPLLLPLLLAGAVEPGVPSLVVMPIAGKAGVHADVAELLTEALSNEFRGRGSFTRVVSTGDMQAALGMEMQKQALNCTAESCAAEIAAALDVSHIALGTVGKVGKRLLFTLKLVLARTGVTLASASSQVDAAAEEALLNEVKPMVDQLLKTAGISAVPSAAAPAAAPPRAVPPPAASVPAAAPAPAPVAAAAPTPAQATSPVKDEPSPRKGPGLRVPLLAAGAASALASAPPVLLGAVAALLVTLVGLSMVSGDPVSAAVRRPTTFEVRAGLGVAGVLGGSVTVLLVLAALGAAAGLVVAGVVLG